MRYLKQLIQGLENPQIPFFNYILSFLFIVLLRHYLEAYSQVTNYLDLPAFILSPDILHFALSYINLAMLLILIFYLAVDLPIPQIARVVLPAFILLLLTPLLDLLVTKGFGASILYIQPDFPVDIVKAYFAVGGDFKGVSFGIKCEIICVLLGCFGYFLVKKLNIGWSLFYTWVIYSVIFLWGSSPFLIKWFVETCGLSYQFSGEGMIQYYLITNFFLFLFVLYLAVPSIFIALMKDLRGLRFLHYELMLLLGITIALVSNVSGLGAQIRLQQDMLSHAVLCSMSLFFASIFSIIMNNIADKKIDAISNSTRPHITQTINMPTYQFIGYTALVLSLFYAYMVAPQAFLTMATVVGGYYLYSVRPFRFKRAPLFSKAVIAFNSIILVVLGYFLVQGGRYDFPFAFFLIFLLGITVAANVIDFKDIAGDKAGNVLTLPILLGEKRAKIFVGAAYWLLFLSFYLLVRNNYFLIITFILGGVQFYLINKKHYQEWLILLFSDLSMLGLIIYLLLARFA